jgi:hypothetical protein
MKLAHDNGKGVVAMKVLGNAALPLVRDYKSSIKSIAQLNFIDTIVIGMKNLNEVKNNVKVILS